MNAKEYRKILTEELAESDIKDYRKGIGFALTILDDMIENPIHQNYISGCKYPKESRSYHFCVACSEKDMCKESVVIETYRD